MKLAALIKKEFLRFFRDPRLIVTMLLPGILIFVIYSIMGSVMWNEEPTDYSFNVLVCGSSQATNVLSEAIGENGWTVSYEEVTAEGLDGAKAAVEQGEKTALLVFSENFDEAAERGVEIYFRADSDEGYVFGAYATEFLRAYSMSFPVTVYNFESEQNAGTSVMQSLLPFLIVVLIFSACMSVTIESVAGEKERGTLATVLVTSVKRSHIALGKVIPLACIALIGAASSFLGVILSLPKLMGTSIGAFAGGYGFVEILFLFLLITSITPLIVAAISTVSTYSKSVKEAAGYTSTFMILVMILSLLAAFLSGFGAWVVAVPVFNAVAVMQEILAGTVVVWKTLVSVGLNLVYTAGLVYLISRMLSSERIMFGK